VQIGGTAIRASATSSRKANDLDAHRTHHPTTRSISLKLVTPAVTLAAASSKATVSVFGSDVGQDRTRNSRCNGLTRAIVDL